MADTFEDSPAPIDFPLEFEIGGEKATFVRGGYWMGRQAILHLWDSNGVEYLYFWVVGQITRVVEE